ncbi:MAG TPA: MaoC family dehydratase [Pseudomonadales bacterium]|nr:MaoC family dehydratase [Pseudomonadales bacterium]
MYWEDFEVGKRYDTYGRTVTEGDLSLFCAFVGYHVPLFIDEEYAKRTQYGGRIAPSAFTMSISTAMTESLFRNTVLSLLSVERGRFLAPVRAGDTIRTEVEVISMKETRDPGKGVVTFRDHVLNQKGETVFEIDKVVMLKRRVEGTA